MIINFTDKHQFTTRLQLKGENIDVVNKMKMFGTIINDKMTWDEDCSFLIKKCYACMQLLRNVYSVGATNLEMVHLWTVCKSRNKIPQI